MNFGAGRRICPGMMLAIRILFLMLGSLINSFDWKLEGCIKPEDVDMDGGRKIWNYLTKGSVPSSCSY